jgi:hypothetical protein
MSSSHVRSEPRNFTRNGLGPASTTAVASNRWRASRIRFRNSTGPAQRRRAICHGLSARRGKRLVDKPVTVDGIVAREGPDEVVDDTSQIALVPDDRLRYRTRHHCVLDLCHQTLPGPALVVSCQDQPR